MDPTTEVISLWQEAQESSDQGRFHEAVVSFENAKTLLEVAVSDPLLRARVGPVLSELVRAFVFFRPLG